MEISTSLPIKLDGTFNTRELGGYETVDGKITKTRRYLRSDGLANITESDLDILHDYGVKSVIDLRSDTETKKSSYNLKREMKYLNFPLLDQVQSSGFSMKDLPKSMGELYIRIMEMSKSTVANILKAMAKAGDSCVLFHCTAGKDRTGVTAMLLLKQVGVPNETIVADYAITEVYMEKVLRAQIEAEAGKGIKIPDDMILSKAYNMEMAIDHLEHTYGTVEDYMQHIGITLEEMNRLKTRLIEM